ncbi:MAG: DUF3787 domain-containing protein [Clostridiales bacterium]|jgi:hypothetical protein|nr:DUF3787 domain-containing protein [Clostridiales bacterium]
MKKREEENKKNIKNPQKSNMTGVYITQPISQPDSRQEKTNVALPNDDNVGYNKDWVDENGKS